MRHNIELEGFAFRLRPIGDEDAEFVVQLRTDTERGRFIHVTSNKVEDQLAWFADYYERPGDYYFVIERRQDKVREGMISIYEIDETQNTAEWGRWVLRPGSLAAIESAWLMYRVAFENLMLVSVCSRTIVANTEVVSFHDSCGIADRKLLPNCFDINGQCHDAVIHRVDLKEWNGLAPRLAKLAQRTARKIHA